MHALTGKNFSFQTAKIAGYQTINGQAANAIDIPTVQRQVRQAFTAPVASSGGKHGTAKNTAPVPPASTVTVDVYNGSGAPGLAGGVSQALVSKGYKGGAVKNAAEQPHQVQPATQVFYNAATAANAAKIAGYFGADREREHVTARRVTWRSCSAPALPPCPPASARRAPRAPGHPRQRRRRPGTTARLPGR